MRSVGKGRLRGADAHADAVTATTTVTMTFNPRFILTSTGTSERWPDVPGIEIEFLRQKLTWCR
jgi:thioredoxin reductase